MRRRGHGDQLAQTLQGLSLAGELLPELGKLSQGGFFLQGQDALLLTKGGELGAEALMMPGLFVTRGLGLMQSVSHRGNLMLQLFHLLRGFDVFNSQRSMLLLPSMKILLQGLGEAAQRIACSMGLMQGLTLARELLLQFSPFRLPESDLLLTDLPQLLVALLQDREAALNGRRVHRT